MTATHIIRVSSNCDTVTIARATARDRRLTFQARGMLLALLAMGDGAETSIDALVDESPAGRDAVYSTLAELRVAGYVDRYAERGPSGKIIRWVTWVREVTQEDAPDVAGPLTAGPLTAEPDTAKPEVVSYSVTHSPTKPYLAKPEVAVAQPAKSPPTRDVFIPPPVRKETIPATSSVAGGFRAKTLAHISASLGGLRVEKAGGNALAWAGQIVGLLGGWSDDDDAAAAVIWDAFRASERWRFKGAKPADWPIAMGDWYANEYRPTVRRAIILGER